MRLTGVAETRRPARALGVLVARSVAAISARAATICSESKDTEPRRRARPRSALFSPRRRRRFSSSAARARGDRTGGVSSGSAVATSPLPLSGVFSGVLVVLARSEARKLFPDEPSSAAAICALLRRRGEVDAVGSAGERERRRRLAAAIAAPDTPARSAMVEVSAAVSAGESFCDERRCAESCDARRAAERGESLFAVGVDIAATAPSGEGIYIPVYVIYN